MRLIAESQDGVAERRTRPALDWRPLIGWLGAIAFSVGAWAGVILMLSHSSE